MLRDAEPPSLAQRDADPEPVNPEVFSRDPEPRGKLDVEVNWGPKEDEDNLVKVSHGSC
ncbi:hypothetical protein QQZ08_002232 [Neonectria magnoliae]|uniref:Uncharacterized protein n=1 Tax=Neonectria magnoliae TaxID=2732573 RepID=A0ABR1IEC4_9HYPO